MSLQESAQRLYARFAPARARTGAGRALVPDARSRAGFRAAQRLAYDCVTAVEAQLRPGMTEKDAARLLAEDLAARGVRTYLHRPFAWFAEHSRFTPYAGDFHAYHPSDKPLAGGAAYILDVSPIVDGYMADIGYTVCPAETAEQAAAKKFLIGLRSDIPAMFASASTLREIWHEVDGRVRAAGYENCHAMYPLRVLGHRVYRVRAFSRLVLPRLPVELLGFDWFSPQGVMSFLGGGLVPDLITPENEGKKGGFWAIEPHVGGAGWGAKFEEILVVDEDGTATWLDDDTPHMREARSRGWA